MHTKKLFYILVIIMIAFSFIPTHRVAKAATLELDSALKHSTNFFGRTKKIFIIPVKKNQNIISSEEKYAQELFYYLPRNGVKGYSINYAILPNGGVYRSNAFFQRSFSPSNLVNSEVGILAIFNDRIDELANKTFIDSLNKIINEEIIPDSDLNDLKDIEFRGFGFENKDDSILIKWNDAKDIETIKSKLDIKFDTVRKNELVNDSTNEIAGAYADTVAEFPFNLKNKSQYSAYLGQKQKIELRRAKDSIFYVTDVWLNPRTVFIDENNYIDPDSSRTYTIKVKTPLLPGEYKEEFELTRNGEVISKPVIKLKVIDTGQKVLKIRWTGLGYLVVRKESSISSDEIGKAPEGAMYQFTELKDNFYKINFNGKDGWVSARYVDVVKK